MHRARGEAKKRGRRCAILLLNTIIAGCATATNQTANNDPLFGEVQPRAAAPSTAAPQQAQKGVPAAATSRIGHTNAGLASATPLPDGRPPLAIPDNRAAPPGNNPPQLAANTKPAPPKVMPLPREGSPTTIFASGPAGGQPQPSTVANPVQDALKARGVLFQKVDAAPEGVRFQCIVPSKQNPETTRVFEATARDYATAVQAVLKKIDEQK